MWYSVRCKPRSRDEIPYPYIQCVHGKEKSYIVCSHVMSGQKIEYFEEATETGMGVVICNSCVVASKDATFEKIRKMVFICCATHVLQRGWM